MAQEYLLECECGQQNRVQTRQAGTAIQCVSCGQEVVIPRLRELECLPQTEDEPAAGRKGWNLGRGICFSTGLAMLLISLAVSTTYGVRSAGLNIKRPPPIDPDRKLDYQRLRPVEAWTAWERIRVLPLLRRTPEYIQNRRQRNKYVLISAVAGGIGLLGLLAVVASLIPGRDR